MNIVEKLKAENIIQNRISNIEILEEDSRKYTIEDILLNLECKKVSYQIKSDDETYYEINLIFKYNLYEDNKSQEEYFNNIVNVMKKRVNLPFKLIDTSKNITIYVDKKNGIYQINGKENFYKDNKWLEVHNHKTPQSKLLVGGSFEWNALTSAEWKRDKIKLQDEVISIDENFLNYENYRLKYDGIDIVYVEFSDKYEESVISNLKVGTSLLEIKAKLGEPNFKYDNEMIGYKLADNYLFCYDNKFVVYPNKAFFNNNFEQSIVEYVEGKYNGYRTMLIKELLDSNSDLKCDIIEGGVKIYSFFRGVEVYLYDNNEYKIVIYDNYNLGSYLKSAAECGDIELNYDEDSIFKYEIEKN